MMIANEEQKIAHAFNAGYLMQEHEPELLSAILKSNNQNNQYTKAMATGKETQEEQQKKKEQELKKAREKIVKQQKQIRELKKSKKRGR